MRKYAKKCISILTLGAVALSCVLGNGNLQTKAAGQVRDSAVKLPQKTDEIITPDNPATFRDLSSERIIQEMGAGWNLGNTLDGHTGLTPAETAWQPSVTTRETIKTVHDMGFNTVRVPVTWGNMINGDYSVRESWMNRVQDVVDYCIEQDMYVILNMHHDGAEAMYWFNLKLEGAELDKVWEKFRGLWKTIAERFKNYDEHLIFESMNEIQGGKWDQEEAGTQFGVNINKANQIFVDTVRSTGSNNSRRWLSIPPWGTRIAVANNAEKYGFQMPKDTLENPRLMLAVHDYAPVNKCLNGTDREDNDITLSDVVNSYENNFKELNENYVTKGIPVVLAEYGAVDKDNTPQRELYCEGVNVLAKKYQIVGVYWDDGGVDNNAFALVDRKKNIIREGYESISYALMRGFQTQTDIAKVTAGAQIVPITDFQVDGSVALACNSSVQMAVSQVQPGEHNDAILWKTADPRIATVYQGMIRGRGVGETVITAYAQNGAVAKEVKVTVTAQEGTAACDNIVVGAGDGGVTAYMGHACFLDARVGTENCSATLGYYSEDTSVATVSSLGKVTGVREGNTNIVIVSSTGYSKKVPVTVENAPWDGSQFRLALHIYYNDNAHEFYDDVMSTEVVTVQGPGQYCVKFDCATDLTDRAKAAGVTTINNAGAIYLKDVDVDEGKITQSALKSGNISYQCIRINGITMAIADKEKAFPLVKTNHIIDTNNPINAWGDYAILEEEVDATGNRLTFKKVPEPTVIEVYFTLSDLRYDDDTVMQSPDGKVPTLAVPTDTPEGNGGDGDAQPKPTKVPGDGSGQPNPTKVPGDGDIQPSPSASPKASPAPLKKGAIVSDRVSQGKYQITKADAKKGTVSYIKCNGKKSAVTVPDKITVKGIKYSVTGIGKKAFSGNKKIKSVTLGKNIAKIGDKAFYGCKSLKKIQIRSSKLTKVGKKAVGNIAKKARIKVPKKKHKKYKKLFGKKTGFGKNMKLR